MARDPNKGHAALRRRRASIPNASYFVTICTDNRGKSLLEGGCLGAILAELGCMEGDEALASLRCVVVMPDHLHLLFQLGSRLTLGQIVSRLKSKTGFALRRRGLQWQRGYHDHRIDPEEAIFPILAYMYRNPARADLVSAEQIDSYSGWWICQSDAEWFHEEARLARWDEMEAPKWASG